MKFLSCFIFALHCVFICNGQGARFKKYKYEWPKEPPKEIRLNEMFKDEDAVILEEKCIFNESGNRVPEYQFINYSANYFFIDQSVQGLNPVVQKKLRIKFLTQNGIDRFGRIVLPESFDPSADFYNVRPQWRDSIFRPLGEHNCIRHFVARIINPDGSTREVIVKDSTREEIINGKTQDSKFYSWIFQLTGLKPGDEVEIDYSYEGVYNYGISNRIFFDSDIPKQKLDFTFRYLENRLFMLTYFNGANPVDSTMVTKTTPHYTEYYFHFENLKGGINEPGARPYKELPYFSYYEHRLDYGIADPVTKFIKKPLRYPWTYKMLPYVGFKYENLKVRMGRMDKTTVELNSLTENLREKSSDTSAAKIISILQEDLARDFDFKEDVGYYIGETYDIEHLGKNLENKILRQMSRLRVYDEVMLRLDKPFYHSILTDNRIADLDFNSYQTLVASRVSIAIPYREFILNFYPKSYRFGYAPNELPFYYEDCNSVLIPQHIESVKKYELVPIVEFKFIRTPSSNIKDNVRTTSASVNVSLDSLKVDVKAKVRLTGQFSTLTRGYYQYGSMDTTINPSYFNLITSTADNSKDIQVNVGKTESRFPFECNVGLGFSSSNQLIKKSEKEFALKLGNWFNNVIDEDFTAEKRRLNYYPDFQSMDIHRYMIHFTEQVEIQNIDELSKRISNTFSEYEIKASQPSPNDLLIETGYSVKSNMVSANMANDVETVFDAIKKLKSTDLIVRKIN